MKLFLVISIERRSKSFNVHFHAANRINEASITFLVLWQALLKFSDCSRCGLFVLMGVFISLSFLFTIILTRMSSCFKLATCMHGSLCFQIVSHCEFRSCILCIWKLAKLPDRSFRVPLLLSQSKHSDSCRAEIVLLAREWFLPVSNKDTTRAGMTVDGLMSSGHGQSTFHCTLQLVSEHVVT